MKFLMIVSSFLCSAFISKTQDVNEYTQTDRIALNIPSAQTNTTADIAAYINEHFDTDNKKIRAAYTWVANNIRYDAAHLHRVILNEDHEEKVTWAIERKKGVCENFAAILTDICKKSGLRSYFIEGYTRHNGSIERWGHAWSAVFIDNNWYLYDPTWDAGFQQSGSFVNQSGTNYYQVLPSEFIQSHMPFDPLFQFLEHPLTYEEFSKGFVKSKSNTPYFNYIDSIAAFEKMQPLAQYTASAIRIEKNGVPTGMISTKLSQLKMEKEIIYQDKDVDLYNSAIADYTASIANFKNFLNYRNNQFMPAKPASETEGMLNEILKQIEDANDKLFEVNRSKATLALNTGDVEKILNDLTTQVKEQQIFLRNYLITEKEK
ncbi:MAG: transglutaminase-like domain-containing protein [Ginsengibacter sp.]